jgi:hypothetical protein
MKRYYLKMKIIRLRELRGSDATLISTGQYKQLGMEIFLNLILCPPAFDFSFSYRALSNCYCYCVYVCVGKQLTYSFNDLCTFFGLTRFYLTLRLFEYYSHWTNERSKRVCHIIGVKADPVFALKAYLKSQPYIVLSIGLSLSLIFLGLALRIAERYFFLVFF